MGSYKDGKAVLKIVYEGKDITVDLNPYLISLTYRDKAVGEADELTIELRNNSFIWMWVWNPQKGDAISAEIIQGDASLPCGKFTVDEVTFRGSRDAGHVATIMALGAGIKEQLRTKTSFAHEGKTLKELVKKYADKYHYKVQGLIHNFSIARVTQWHETDLGFLQRIAEQFGYFFSVKGDIMVFTYLPDMNNAAGAVTVRMDAALDYFVRDKVAGVYVKAQNRYYNKKQKKLFDNLVQAGAQPSFDGLTLHGKADNDEQGIYKAGGRLYKKNMEQVEIDVKVPGNIYLLSGNNVNTVGWFNYNGVYMIAQAAHTVTRDGSYITHAIYKKIVKNKGAAAAPADTEDVGVTKPVDVTNFAIGIYDQLQRLIETGNYVEWQAIIGNVNSKIGVNLMSMRTAGAADISDVLYTKYSGIQTESAGGVGYDTAILDCQDMQQMLLPYMKSL